jgi:hypothetical protein
MSRVITSPVKRWPGTITLSDPLTYEQVFAWQDAIEAGKKAGEEYGNSLLRIVAVMRPGILACIERHDLGGGFSLDRWPATPAGSANQLAAWVIGEITRLFDEAEEDVNP